jgi:long-chain acyl-CoA synthetase
MTTMYDTLAAAAARGPEREALVHRDTRLTYRELMTRVEAMSAQFRAAGIGPGTRVALMVGGLHYVEAFFAVAAVAAVSCPVDPRLPADAISHVLTDVDADVVFAHTTTEVPSVRGEVVAVDDQPDRSLHELVNLGAPGTAHGSPTTIDPQAPAAIFQTAGTADRPVSVLHSHASLMRSGPALEHAMRRELTPSLSPRRNVRTFKMYTRLGRRLARAARHPAALVPLALQNISGHTTVFNMLATGGRLVIADTFNPHRTLELVEREKITNLGGTPMMLELLLRVKRPFDTRSLLLIASGGELASPRLLQRLEERFGCLVAVGYGATELGGAAMLTTLGAARDRLDTVGRPLPGVEVRIPDGDEGELHVRVDPPMLGYWRQPDYTAQKLDTHGWYRTGDLARRERDGRIRILGRAGDVIRYGETGIPAPTVERALEGEPGVDAVAVVAAPPHTNNAGVVAFVEARSDTRPDEAALRARANKALPPGWELARVVMLPHLPRTTDGKIRKDELRATLTDPSPAS